MRNRLPSLLTAARFPLALGLLAAEVSTRFLALYLLCCLTDVLDGLAARRLNACSAFGARLDSAADLAVTAVLVWRLWPLAAPDPWLTLWICVAAAVRLAAALAARLRFGRFGFLHTWGNKCTGVLLALYPFALVLTGSRWTLVIGIHRVEPCCSDKTIRVLVHRIQAVLDRIRTDHGFFHIVFIHLRDQLFRRDTYITPTAKVTDMAVCIDFFKLFDTF